MIWRKLAVLSITQCKLKGFWVLSQTFGEKSPKIGGVLIPVTPAFLMNVCDVVQWTLFSVQSVCNIVLYHQWWECIVQYLCSVLYHQWLMCIVQSLCSVLYFQRLVCKCVKCRGAIRSGVLVWNLEIPILGPPPSKKWSTTIQCNALDWGDDKVFSGERVAWVGTGQWSLEWGLQNPFIHWRAGDLQWRTSHCGSNYLRRKRFNSWQI